MAPTRRGSTGPSHRCPALERENRRLERELSGLQSEKEQLEGVNGRMQEEIRRLEEALEKARRAGKRQAAPFSKGEPKKNPRRPGRKPGDKHGPSTWRPIPERIDEVVDVRLPERCSHPDCQGEVEETAVVPQYQAELPPVQPRNIRFDVHVGRCKSRGHRVQGRHPRQTSDALGAAASQIGPRALAVAAELNKGLGLSYGKVQRIFAVLFGLAISRGGLCLAIQRLARKAQPTYDALVDSVRVSPMVVADETGWKVGGRLQWLWVFVTKLVTVYAIQAGRGFAEAAEILGEHYAGKLVRDGLASYRRFKQAIHQSCLGHILRRCSEILATAQGGSARVPTATKRILQKALALRDRRDQGLISPHGLAVAAGHLRAEMDRFLCWRPKVEENRKLLKHLRNERDALFTFLLDPQVPATNWAAEQAIRPAVVTRKVCGGNRTWNGALAQEILASVLQTARQQKRDPLGILVPLVCSAEPIVADALLEPIGPSDPSP